MTPSALALAEALPQAIPQMGAASGALMRDFSQPWLDLNDKSVLVTGGTGSFGKHFLKTVIAQYKPRRLIIFSRDELKQFEMQQEFSQEKYPFLRYFIGDVRDRDRLDLALRDVDYVVHAAAMKQVTTAEYNPFECIRTNVFGAENIVTASIRCGVKRVVALVHRQGRQSGQSLWRLQAGFGQDFRRRQQFGRRRRHPFFGGALWQCLRFARFGGALLPQADRRRCRQPADHRCPDDPLLDHLDPGRQFRALQHGNDARRRDLCPQDSLHHHS